VRWSAPSTGVLGINYWNWNGGGSPSEFTSLSNLVAGQANQVLALTRRGPNIMNITGLTGLNEQIFTQNGSTLTAIYPDGNSTNFCVNGMPQWFALQALYNTSEIATYELVQHAVLVGSDPIVTGALAAARVQDTTTPAVYADLLVAQDYERYRTNAEIINTAMAANPDSDFTAGWNVTLMRAQGLGLDRIVSHPGWTADLTDSNETIRDANGNVVQQLTFNADGSVTTDTGTLVFNFNFVDSRLSYGIDGHTYLTSPDGVSHDLTGATRLFFNDGHIDEADGAPLVDDLYYDSEYPDVYLAGMDPEAHYAQYGWHEGRNPNAYFDTNYYLAQSPDVAAAGINPLEHFNTYGWHEGRNHSARFSTRGYLSAYPDVAAVGIDPLTHFLQFGMTEGRMSRGTDMIRGDFNGDGVADILMRNAITGDDAIAYGDAVSGGFTWQPQSNVPVEWNVQGVADFNGDGRDDILWHNASGWSGIYYSGSTPGSFTGLNLGQTSADWTIQCTGDFNGDGRGDIFWRNASNNDTVVWYMNDGPVPYSAVDFGVAASDWSVQRTGDFNGDGVDDIVWRSSTNGDTGVQYLQHGLGLNITWQDFGLFSSNWTIQPAGDFNGDGRDDLLWRNSDNAGVVAWYMTGPGSYNWQVIGTMGFGSSVAEVADFSGDGRSDILWRNANGTGSLWTAAADGSFASRDIALADAAWRMAA
jgi:hypothetical protein